MERQIKKDFGDSFRFYYCGNDCFSCFSYRTAKCCGSNNENFEFTPDSVRLRQPNKVYVNEWIKVDPSHVQMKKAADFSMENVYAPSSAEDVAYNRWNYLSSQVFYDFLLSVGFEPGLATYVAFVVFEGGLYYKEVYTGN